MNVYFVRATGTPLVKIGVARNLDQRLKSLRASSPLPLELLGAYSYQTDGAAFLHERQLHDALKDYRLHGEWFDLPITVLNDFLAEIERVA